MSSSNQLRLAQQLVQALVPECDNPSRLSSLANKVTRDVKADLQAVARKEWEDIRIDLQELSRTARIRIQEDLADALDKNLKELETCRSKGNKYWEGDGNMRMSNLPQYVHLLINLISKPNNGTHEFAYQYLNRVRPSGPTADQILYNEIMNSEPFELDEEVWDEEVLSGWTDSDSNSEDHHNDTSDESDDNSPEEDYVKTPSSTAIRLQRKKDEAIRRQRLEEDRRQESLDIVRNLKFDQYWNKPGIVKDMKEGLYGWKDLITRKYMEPFSSIWRRELMSLFQTETHTASLVHNIENDSSRHRKAITSSQLQREIVFALSGRSGILFRFTKNGECTIIPDHPQVHHLSPVSLEHILNKLKGYAQQAALIREYIANILQPDQTPAPSKSPRSQHKYNRPNKTQQAFAGACQEFMQKFDIWLSDLEASFTIGSHSASSSTSAQGISAASTPSLLQLELEKKYEFIFSLINSYIPHSKSATILLNLIYTTIKNVNTSSFSDSNISSTLNRIFVKTVKPIWDILGIWLQHGMPIPKSLTDLQEEGYTNFDLDNTYEERLLPNEFFIMRDRDVSWLDEDFHENGFIANDDGYPDCFGNDLGELILEAGKARGLLRSLLGGIGMIDEWIGIEQVLNIEPVNMTDTEDIPSNRYPSINITEKITNYLTPICQITQFQSRRVLDEECGLEEHLDAIEGLMFHKGYEVLHDWGEILFNKMSNKEKWGDFQALTNTFRDTIEEKQAAWMNPAAIRIRTVRFSGAIVGTRALEAIRASYEVPFPLSQLFSSTSMELRSEVFTFLLQLRMAQYLVNQTKSFDRDLLARLQDGNGVMETRSLWMTRQKLKWFVDMLYTWLTERIIEVENIKFRRKLSEMTSLKSMITLELAYTRKIRNYAFLNTATSEIYESIQHILDLTQTLSEYVNSYMIQFSSHSFSSTQVTRSIRPKEDFITHRKPKPRRKSKKPLESTTDSDEDEKNDNDQEFKDTSISFKESSLIDRLDKVNKDLELYIQQIKEGIDELVSHAQMDEEMDGWNMLAFALEEWR
ncbi:uncharacterized protein L201_002403 [Kwoniella dendrophila CBS 6074]|uniref:Spindle pole body component n=1 Tax=Kwoniella dendrophila CBS 6074 TaxID=1295534 RepID=A0AAX4JRI0_9TREE